MEHRGPTSKFLGGPNLFLHLLSPSLPFTFPSLPLSSARPSLPLEVGPLNTARGFWEHCKLPQLGLLGRSPSGIAETEFGAF